MHWILLIAMSGGYSGSSPAVAGVEFDNLPACQFAARALRDKAEDSKVNIDYAGYVCVPKGGV